jgi:hypothetical protein
MPEQPYELRVDVRDRRPVLSIAGHLGRAAVEAAADVLTTLVQVPAVVHLLLHDVTDVETDGVRRLLELAADRTARGLPPLCIETLNPAVRDALSAAGVRTDPGTSPVTLDADRLLPT